jgi:hypothetical protein
MGRVKKQRVRVRFRERVCLPALGKRYGWGKYIPSVCNFSDNDKDKKKGKEIRERVRHQRKAFGNG